MSIKEIYEANVKEHCYIHLAKYKGEDEPLIDLIWEGYIEELPEQYFSYEVVETGQSLKDLEQGITGYYVYVIYKE